MPNTNEFDAIVVGSGITGGWAAKELAEKGLKVVLLERGRHVEHGKDYVTEHKPEWEYPYRLQGERQLFEDEYQVQKQCYAFNESTKHFFANDKRHPYSTPADKPFSWIRGYHLGGRSLTWARQCYRWSDLDFEANAKDGFGVDWPIRYKDIAPWYDYVETFAGISGQAEGLPQLPDGKFLPPMQMSCVEQHVKESIAKHFSDRMMTIGRCAVLTQAHNGRAACHYCGPCQRGCSTGSYFSSPSATLPAALATGNLTIKTDSIAHSIMFDETKNRATGVRVIDANTRQDIEYKARIVFMCASTLGTTQIMLNSTSSRFPNGFANGSGALGHYLMDHTYDSGAGATFEGFEDKYFSGKRPNGIYIPRFQNIKKQHPNFLRGYGFQGGAWRDGWGRGMKMPGFGADFKNALREPGPWRMNIGGWGECLPYEDNYVELSGDKTDEWGIPTLDIHCTYRENEQNIKKEIVTNVVEMLEAAGGKQVYTYNLPSPPGLCIHEMGTARMGKDPKTSVLNAHNQCHEAPNVFVTDGSCMTSSACQNPSITYMALTARACDHAVKELNRMNL